MNGSNCLKKHGSFRRMPWDAMGCHGMPWDAMPVVGHLRWAVEQLSHPMPAVPGQRWTAHSGNAETRKRFRFGSCGSARGTWSLQHNYFSRPGHGCKFVETQSSHSDHSADFGRGSLASSMNFQCDGQQTWCLRIDGIAWRFRGTMTTPQLPNVPKLSSFRLIRL